MKKLKNFLIEDEATYPKAELILADNAPAWAEKLRKLIYDKAFDLNSSVEEAWYFNNREIEQYTWLQFKEEMIYYLNVDHNYPKTPDIVKVENFYRPVFFQALKSYEFNSETEYDLFFAYGTKAFNLYFMFSDFTYTISKAHFLETGFEELEPFSGKLIQVYKTALYLCKRYKSDLYLDYNENPEEDFPSMILRRKNNRVIRIILYTIAQRVGFMFKTVQPSNNDILNYLLDNVPTYEERANFLPSYNISGYFEFFLTKIYLPKNILVEDMYKWKNYFWSIEFLKNYVKRSSKNTHKAFKAFYATFHELFGTDRENPKKNIDVNVIYKLYPGDQFINFCAMLEQVIVKALIGNIFKDRPDFEKELVQAGDISIIDNMDGYKVVIIYKNHEAAQYFGQGTQWCTAYKNASYFNQYIKDGPLVVFFDLNQKNFEDSESGIWPAVAQLHTTTDQFMDKNDVRLNPTYEENLKLWNLVRRVNNEYLYKDVSFEEKLEKLYVKERIPLPYFFDIADEEFIDRLVKFNAKKYLDMISNKDTKIIFDDKEMSKVVLANSHMGPIQWVSHNAYTIPNTFSDRLTEIAILDALVDKKNNYYKLKSLPALIGSALGMQSRLGVGGYDNRNVFIGSHSYGEKAGRSVKVYYKEVDDTKLTKELFSDFVSKFKKLPKDIQYKTALQCCIPDSVLQSSMFNIKNDEFVNDYLKTERRMTNNFFEEVPEAQNFANYLYDVIEENYGKET